MHKPRKYILNAIMSFMKTQRKWSSCLFWMSVMHSPDAIRVIHMKNSKQHRKIDGKQVGNINTHQSFINRNKV